MEAIENENPKELKGVLPKIFTKTHLDYQIIGQMEWGNSYYEDKFPDLRADFVLANPPFNADWEPGRLSDKDPRIKFGTPPGSNANFLWIQHFIHHLSPN